MDKIGDFKMLQVYDSDKENHNTSYPIASSSLSLLSSLSFTPSGKSDHLSNNIYDHIVLDHINISYYLRGYYSLLHHSSIAMQPLVREITKLLPNVKGSIKKMMPSIECFCYNIIKAVKLEQDSLLFYSKPTGYTSVICDGTPVNTHVGYKGTMTVVNKMEELGYIECFKGYHYADTGEYQSGYIKLTHKGVDLVKSVVNLDKVNLRKDNSVLVLRSKEDGDLEFKQTTYTKSIVSTLNAYNNMMSNVQVTVLGKRMETSIKRIFNDDFTKGGRAYTMGMSYQNIPTELRKKILINGKKTAEVDIKGSHISILHTMVGSKLFKGYDPYAINIEGVAEYDLPVISLLSDKFKCDRNPFRELVKVALLIMINASSRKEAMFALREKLNKQTKFSVLELDEMPDEDVLKMRMLGIKNVNIDKLYKALEKKHEAIKQYFFSGAGMWLQKIEGDIFLKVIAKCVEKNYPVLVIHDSCRAQDEHIREIGNFIEQAWEEVVGDTTNLQLEYEF